MASREATTDAARRRRRGCLCNTRASCLRRTEAAAMAKQYCTHTQCQLSLYSPRRILLLQLSYCYCCFQYDDSLCFQPIGKSIWLLRKRMWDFRVIQSQQFLDVRCSLPPSVVEWMNSWSDKRVKAVVWRLRRKKRERESRPLVFVYFRRRLPLVCSRCSCGARNLVCDWNRNRQANLPNEIIANCRHCSQLWNERVTDWKVCVTRSPSFPPDRGHASWLPNSCETHSA